MNNHRGMIAAAAVGAVLTLGLLASTASAGRFWREPYTVFKARYTRLDFSGGFGTVECEVLLEGNLHSHSISKTANSLIGYIEIANVPFCSRGGATVLRETLPWHVTYRSFVGTLPSITALATNVIGLSFRMREPSIGATCLARSTSSSPAIMTYNREGAGVLTSAAVSGSIPCLGGIVVTGSLRGTSSSLTDWFLNPITVTLI